uniref:Uncharacterized protein n=1 Tax=Wuchereria bancrofti TaxID=6293 RepID=A0A1I8EI41_WUCBA
MDSVRQEKYFFGLKFFIILSVLIPLPSFCEIVVVCIWSKKFRLNLHDNPSISNSQGVFTCNNISRSIPAERPRVETAHPYHVTDFSHFQENNLLDYQAGKSLNYNQQFYSVEEHHDDFNLREFNNTTDHRHLSISIPENHFNEQIKNSKLTEEIASHSNPSVNLYSQNIDRIRNHSTQNAPRFLNRTESIDIQRTDRLTYKKPEIYYADNRRVERLTYRPTDNQHTHVTHPIVELSIPKEASNEDALINIPYIDQNINWHYLSRKNSELNNYPIKQQTNISSSNGSTSLIVSEYDHSYSTDAFLDESLLQEKGNMSKSTKEWRSSFSTMRNRFGNIELSSDEAMSNNHNFATIGSMTLPKRTLTKSASQGNLIVNEHLDSNERRRSLLANAVEHRRAAEAPELQRPTSRRELGDFWETTIKNRSVAPRTPSPLTAAQRMKLLNESINENGTNRSGRRFSGDNLARRKANFLEAVKSSSSQTDRITNRRSTIIPSINVEIKQNSNNEPNFASLDSAVAELNNSNYVLNSSGGCAKFPLDDLCSSSPISKREGLTSLMNGALLTHSPSPEATSDASSNYSAPTGLPHPKPKHNIREQLIQAGFEPRGTAIYVNRSGIRFGSAPNFPIPSNGSVASRISEFEKKPGAPNLLRIACAERQRNESSPIKSPLGPMSPRSSVYRTKPVIHADMNGPSLHINQPSTNIESIFQFPQIKQFIEAKIIARLFEFSSVPQFFYLTNVCVVPFFLFSSIIP